MMRWPTPLYRLPHFFISRIKMYGTSCERKDMKTNQIMIRPMGEFTVSQRTKDGYFDAGELLRQWNLSGQEQRKMDVFLNSVSTCKFVEALIAEANEVGLGQNCPKIDNQVVKKSKVKEKGKAGRPKEEVWMHPFLFTKFAMWINPRFEVKVIRFVYDEMIQYRNLAGDAYPKMCAVFVLYFRRMYSSRRLRIWQNHSISLCMANMNQKCVIRLVMKIKSANYMS